mgnify:CR=1 FL=1
MTINPVLTISREIICDSSEEFGVSFCSLTYSSSKKLT